MFRKGNECMQIDRRHISTEPEEENPVKDLPAHDYYGLQLPSVDISELTTRPSSTVSLLRQTQKLRDEYYVAPPDIDDVIEADTVLSSSVTLGVSLSPIVEGSSSSHAVGNNLLVCAGIRHRGKQQEYRPSFALHPLDRVRWWLLYPGRLELLLWMAGTALLVTITCVLLFVTTISLGIVSFGHSATVGSTASAAQCVGAPVSAGAAQCDSSTAISPTGLKITLLNTTALLTSTPLQLSGQGFSPQGRVTFMYDNNQLCSPRTLQADAHGQFTVTVTLPEKPSLRPGHHRLIVDDQARKQSVSLDILFTADTTSVSGS